jgi:hypothetical protein
MLKELLYNHTRCGDVSLIASYAISDDQQIAQGYADMENGILILLAEDASVTFFGEKQGGGAKDRNLAHL